MISAAQCWRLITCHYCTCKSFANRLKDVGVVLFFCYIILSLVSAILIGVYMSGAKRAQCTLEACNPDNRTAIYINARDTSKMWTVQNSQCNAKDVGKSRLCYTYNRDDAMLLGFPRLIAIAIGIMAPGWIIVVILMMTCIFSCIETKLNDLDALEAGNANATAPATLAVPLDTITDNLYPLDYDLPTSGANQIYTIPNQAVRTARQDLNYIVDVNGVHLE